LPNLPDFAHMAAGIRLALAEADRGEAATRLSRGIPMADSSAYNDLEPVAGTKETAVQVLSMRMKIHDLSIDQPAIVAYFKTIPADKQEIALVHALQVGITELAARRERFRH
jgi:hypothetical protein